MAYESLEDIAFDESDKNLFQIDDLRLKADAIKYSILPKLHILTHHAILKIKEIYDIDVLEDSHIPQSPNFRTKRDNDLKLDYDWACVGLTGKRIKGKWHGFKRKDGKPVQIEPFVYQFMLSKRGLGIYLQCYETRLSDDSYSKILHFHLQFEGLIHTLCYNTGIVPFQLSWGEGCEPFSPFAEYYQWMIDKKMFFNDFCIAHDIAFPIMPDDLSELVDRFAWFYPVYDSYIQIAKGEEVRFIQLIEWLNQWYRKNAESEDAQSQNPQNEIKSNEEEIIKAKDLAEQKIKVMPAMRWRVFQRDKWKCVSCGRSAANDVILHVDHIIPRSKGGKDELDNYQTLCHICNIGKSNKDDTNLRKLNKK